MMVFQCNELMCKMSMNKFNLKKIYKAKGMNKILEEYNNLKKLEIIIKN